MMSLFFSLIIIILAALFLRGAFSLAPWVPTRREAITRLGNVIDIKPSEYFLEIGSGDGRVISSLATKFPDAIFRGIEIVPYLYLVGLIRKYIYKQKNLELRLGDALREDFSHYHHIFVFGLPESIEKKVLPKFECQALSGTKLYSYAFSFPKSSSAQVESLGEEGLQKIHIYTKK